MNMKRNGRSLRRGSAIVETAVMAPLVMTAMLGMMEVGYSFMVRQTVTNAAREGARAAVLPGATSVEVNAAVASTMGAASLTGYTATTNLDSLGVNDLETWVEVSIPFSRASFTGALLGAESFVIKSRSTMRREGVTNTSGSQDMTP